MRVWLLLSTFLAAPALAQNQIPPPSQSAQGDVAVTIYNNNLALVQDTRRLDIAAGPEAGSIAGSVPDTGGVYFVPALAGLGAPWWDPYARGTIVGITRGTTRAHLVRAAVEAMAYQTRDVVDAMVEAGGVGLAALKADGGASAMDLMLQLQADLLRVPVRRPVVQETTAMGAAFLAGLGTGVWSTKEEAASAWALDREFTPGDADAAGRLYEGWLHAVDRSRSSASRS
jgi:glycerol kinase